MKLSKPVFLLLVAMIAFGLSYTTFVASFVASAQHDGVDPVFGLYINADRQEESLRLRTRSRELRDRLGYMVFLRERAKVQIELADILHRQISLEPFNGRLWRDLFYVQDGLPVDDHERYWVFSTANKLLKWNTRQRDYLMNRCVVNYSFFKRYAPSLCKALLSGLASQDMNRIAGQLKVDYDALIAVLQDQRIRFEGVTQP